jgi:hypothetical protein
MRGLALALLLVRPALAANRLESPGTTAGSILTIPMGSRALGMGTAFTAVASDVSALYYNPAGLSRLSSHEFSSSFSLGLADNSLTYLGYGGPVSFTGLTGNGFASVGSSLLYSRNGIIEISRTSADGSFLGSETKSAGSDVVASLGYAERVGTLSFDWNRTGYEIHHFAGVSGKLVHSKLAEQYTATAYAADVGYLATVPDLGLSAGFAALNFGSKMTFINEGDRLPASLRFGMAYDWGVKGPFQITLAADGDYYVFDRLWRAYSGLEYQWLKAYAVRLGYQFNATELGLTVGFGYRWHERLSLDYAWATQADSNLSAVHRVTFSWKFGKVGAPVRSRNRRPFIETAPERETIQKMEEEDTPIPVQQEPPKRPRPQPRSDPAGAPGWIY